MASTILAQHPHPKYPRLVVQLRANSRYFQALTFLDGKKVQKSVKTSHLATAFKLAEGWYKKLLRASVSDGRQHPLDRLAVDPTMAEVFKSYRTTLTPTRREYADQKWGPIQDFWRTLEIAEVDTQSFRDFYKWRRRDKITNHTIHKDMMVIRQILKYGIEEKHIPALPIIPKVGTIATNPRPWLTESEWERLTTVSEARIKAVKTNAKLYQQRLDCDHFARFMVASMARVDEARDLRFRDCRVRLSEDGKRELLVCTVSGKRGTRDIVTTADAVSMIASRDGEPDDLIFAHHSRDTFRELLKAAGLYRDSKGFARNYKSLRATAISRAVLQPGANLLMIARNAGTSLAMIDAYYAKRLTAQIQVQTSHPVEVPMRS